MKTLRILLAFFASLCLLHAEPSTAILILDGSGSMWGQIDGKAKIDVARATAADIIKNKPEDLKLGFMAYGHRRKGDCDDIELMVTPDKATTESLLAALESITPKGKTPLYKSVLQAAEALRYTEQKASVILVTDGIETCGGDLNALGKLLAEKGVDFKTHVIGFAMSDAQTVDLRALANATGGLYADAGDAASLRSALESAVTASAKPVSSLTITPFDQDGKSVIKNGVSFTLAGADGAEPSQGSGGAWTSEVAPGSYHATATFGERTLEADITVPEGRNATHSFTFTAPILTLKTSMTENSEPLTNGVSWEIMGQPDAEGNRPRIGYSYDAVASFRLAPGDYTAVAKRGNARVEKAIQFGNEPLTETLVFGAGNITATASYGEGSEALSSDLSWAVYGEPDTEGNRPKISYSYDAKPTFTLPAGSYQISVTKGNASTTADVQIESGGNHSVNLVLGSGFLHANAVLTAGTKPIGGMSWSIFGQPDAEGNRPKISYSYDDAPKFTLPSGDYQLVATKGSATTTVDVAIATEKITEVTVDLNAAVVQANAIMTDGSPPVANGGLSWSVFGQPDLEGNRPKVTYSYDNSPKFVLPVGTYQFDLKRGNATTSAEVTVEAGKFNTTTLNLHAGILKTTFADAAGKAIAGSTSWAVLGAPDTEGQRPKVSYSYDAVPTFILPAGDYLIQVSAGDKSAEAQTTVPEGKLSELTVKLAE